MPSGPGKYDDITTLVREMTGAACVVVIVVGACMVTGSISRSMRGV